MSINFMFFVTSLKRKNIQEEEVISNLNLSFIHSDNQCSYSATDIDSNNESCTVTYGRDGIEDETIKSLRKDKIKQHITSLKNTKGSGYIVNQTHITDKVKLIVHSREANNKSGKITSLVIRICKKGDTDVIKTMNTHIVNSV